MVDYRQPGREGGLQAAWTGRWTTGSLDGKVGYRQLPCKVELIMGRSRYRHINCYYNIRLRPHLYPMAFKMQKHSTIAETIFRPTLTGHSLRAAFSYGTSFPQ